MPRRRAFPKGRGTARTELSGDLQRIWEMLELMEQNQA